VGFFTAPISPNPPPLGLYHPPALLIPGDPPDTPAKDRRMPPPAPQPPAPDRLARAVAAVVAAVARRPNFTHPACLVGAAASVWLPAPRRG
jgi:hypothetical protein